MSIYSGSLIRSGGDAKTVKGDTDYLIAIMYLAPYKSLRGNVCPMALMAGCIDGCLNTAGRAGMFAAIPKARQAKTDRYWQDRDQFMRDLYKDIDAFRRYCAKRGKKAAVRLNGTSDIQWEIAHPVKLDGLVYPSIMAAFPDVQFYDYTKVYKRFDRTLPENYRLVLSYSEASDAYREAVVKTLAKHPFINVAVVYRTKALRDSMLGSVDHYIDDCRTVIDGDSDDFRFLDPVRSVVGLYAKGKAKQDQSGFVIG